MQGSVTPREPIRQNRDLRGGGVLFTALKKAMREATVHVDRLVKTYRVADKGPGFAGTITHFFRRRYRSIQAVREISFDIAPGEIVGFLGPNGAGKTTAIKMLTGLVHPTSGFAQVLGHIPWRRRAEFLKRIALVMGNKQQLIWDLPASDSLRINAAVYGLDDREANARIRAFGDILSLNEELSQPVRKLSLGQRMKAELIAALLHHPDVLFLDEPTLGLDVNAQNAVRAFLKDYNRERGASMLLTSHYMADITALADRVIVIHQGKILFDGRLDEVVERFSPYRMVRLVLKRSFGASQLSDFGEVVALEGAVARLSVGRAQLTRTVERILAQLPVEDLTVTEPPIEDVIGKLFAVGDEASPNAIPDREAS